ncbi:hypothetical protein RHGRI_030142 [Rhododendron griersonianum]|uniref:Uncharacterized protein n=1 Tax=Rhododendron griersonianum TaxID=479676 RepID=A0AAV6IS99_9ERIC|nr:hypothetical protein RHGRI_030142 [Rhododendron griersonianum]
MRLYSRVVQISGCQHTYRHAGEVTRTVALYQLLRFCMSLTDLKSSPFPPPSLSLSLSLSLL